MENPQQKKGGGGDKHLTFWLDQILKVFVEIGNHVLVFTPSLLTPHTFIAALKRWALVGRTSWGSGEAAEAKICEFFPKCPQEVGIFSEI